MIYDVILIGSGLATLVTAAKLSDNKKILVITKDELKQSSSSLAQGGIAAVMSPDDHWRYHYEDTLKAGHYYNDKKAVSMLVRRAQTEINILINEGMTFDKENGQVALGMEGAHSKRRILHAGGDATGRELVRHFRKKVCGQSNITIVEHEPVHTLHIENGYCVGVFTEKNHYYGRHTVLASGGCGGLYRFSSNPDENRGDGIALAYRAGATLKDLEFIQFHPTLLHRDGKAFGLVSEAVRGEGGKLIDENGKAVMDYHPLKDLAPRDIVAQTINMKLKKGSKVFLDITNISNFPERFPTIHHNCVKAFGYQPSLLPVAPGAHFQLGGIAVNENSESSIPNLYAIGEVACTGVHGANRLASNSLLEILVYGSRLAAHLNNEGEGNIQGSFFTPLKPKKTIKITLPSIQEIQRNHEEGAGIVRCREELERCMNWCAQYLEKVSEEKLYLYERDAIEKINMLRTSFLIFLAALERRESLGVHMRSDTKEIGQREFIG
ncbi:L-aspartate oxidase [Priestia filamentosa]|uniref:L-aspartate oxidase n=1 Tax=Priestia filamentosa TaxID=1402861 RepID=UPI002E1C3C69|nr:L-aspartate oxidase [Priestia filamentosa]MED3725467.1 L-aspartate oxidase [Priestia filamentosa]